MGSQSKKLRKLHETDLRKVAGPLYDDAFKRAREVENCWDSPGPPIANRKAGGWSVCLSVHKHKNTDGKMIEHWAMSAKLFPFGRGSKEHDWQRIGEFLGRICTMTGYPQEQPPDPITPFESTHPNETLHWHWHDDGSELDPGVARMLRRAIESLPGRRSIN